MLNHSKCCSRSAQCCQGFQCNLLQNSEMGLKLELKNSYSVELNAVIKDRVSVPFNMVANTGYVWIKI